MEDMASLDFHNSASAVETGITPTVVTTNSGTSEGSSSSSSSSKIATLANLATCTTATATTNADMASSRQSVSSDAPSASAFVSAPTFASSHVSPSRTHSLPPQDILDFNSTSFAKTPSALQHTRSQTVDNAITAAVARPVLVSLPPRLSGPVRRKPVSSTASLLIAPYHSHDSPLAHRVIDLPKPDHRFARSPSIDSPTLYDYPASVRSSLPASQESQSHTASAEDDIVSDSDSIYAENDTGTARTDDSEVSDVLSGYGDLLSDHTPAAIPDAESIKGLDEHSDDKSDIESLYADNFNSNTTSPPMFAPKPAPPHLRLEKVDPSIIQEEELHTRIDDSPQFETATSVPAGLNKPLPKSPGQPSPLNPFFGWVGQPSPSGTEFSSIPSPLSTAKNGYPNDARYSANSSLSDYTKTDGAAYPNPYRESYLSATAPSTIGHPALVDEMEEELKAISSELAASIRREMDLEDLVDRLQEQANNPQSQSKRTSDYFSDSGYSSSKLDYDQSREEIEKITRRSEQEKAALRLELTSKLQNERSRRKELDHQIKQLAEKASHVDIAEINSLDAGDRIKDLEATCEDLRRKLSDERQSKSNFEDLLSVLKGQLQDACDERDNLRDEVIPELQARVDGLEAEAAEYTKLTYESSRMQHQLKSLQEENHSLRNSIISGPEELPKRMSAVLSRSNSMGPSSHRAQRPPVFGLTRSDSFKNTIQTDSRESLQEKLKDTELQRDALHEALKSLLKRQEFQNREYEKKIRLLENEKQRLMTSAPRKAGFDRDMSSLRTEISVLRRRAEDALEQKWQVEKGLGGLKMDLDRAEEEIASLRSLLTEKDILIPSFVSRHSNSSQLQDPVTSETLKSAYDDLQQAHAEALERIKQLEADVNSDESQQFADSASRIEQLSSEVQQQLAMNSELRSRLAAAVARGDTDRKANSERISEMQERLKSLEDQVVAAQTSSEDRVARHEEEMANLQAANSKQLSRLQDQLEATKKSPKALLSISKPVQSKSLEDEADMKKLRARVTELENALNDAEKEMQEVVARMNMAQVEVLNLQEERESAVRETRRLEQLLKQESSKTFGWFRG